MALRYEIKHDSAHDGVLYTRQNQDDVKALPRAVRDEWIALGFLVEYDDRKVSGASDVELTAKGDK